MFSRTILKNCTTTSRTTGLSNRLRNVQPSMSNPFFTTTTSSSTTMTYPNSNYDIEAYYRQEVMEALRNDASFRNSMAYSLAMATSEGSKFPPLTDEMSPRMKEQLERSKTQLHSSSSSSSSVSSSSGIEEKKSCRLPIDDRSLPRTLEDALRPSNRAIVITDIRRPFRVQDVNKAWEGLCGYSYLEAKNQNLGDLLGGQETDPLAISALLNQLLRGEAGTAILTNYTKSGRKFRNRLHAGPLYDENGMITHFVGVLQEVEM